MRDDRFRRWQRARRVGDRFERTWPPDDELQDLREDPRIDQPEHDGRGRGHASPGEAPRAKQKERQDPPEEAVPVQIRERDGDDRGGDVPLGRHREVELRVECAERADDVVQRARRCRQTKSATPRTITATTM